MFCDIHPELAKKHGIQNGKMMWVHSPAGTKIKVKAKYSHTVLPNMVFLPFHFGGYMQGVDMTGNFPVGTKPYASGECANTVVSYGYDIITQIPASKAGLCRVEKA
jgi:formate dehydrogenase major subunit